MCLTLRRNHTVPYGDQWDKIRLKVLTRVGNRLYTPYLHKPISQGKWTECEVPRRDEPRFKRWNKREFYYYLATNVGIHVFTYDVGIVNRTLYADRVIFAKNGRDLRGTDEVWLVEVDGFRHSGKFAGQRSETWSRVKPIMPISALGHDVRNRQNVDAYLRCGFLYTA